jgi:CBS domain-containing protein
MTTVKHVLDQKGHDVHFIHPDASVFDALKMMAESNIGSLVVLEDGKLVGVITERHYAREIVLKGRTSPGTLVRDIMSTKVIYAVLIVSSKLRLPRGVPCLRVRKPLRDNVGELPLH